MKGLYPLVDYKLTSINNNKKKKNRRTGLIKSGLTQVLIILKLSTNIRFMFVFQETGERNKEGGDSCAHKIRFSFLFNLFSSVHVPACLLTVGPHGCLLPPHHTALMPFPLSVPPSGGRV